MSSVHPFRRLSLIVAMTPEGGIGKDGTLPWKSLKSDMKFFKQTTLGAGKNAVVMGRKTWQSIPSKFRPLAGRRNIVISRNPNARAEYDIPDTVPVVSSFAAVEDNLQGIENCFVIGGAAIYNEALKSTLA